MYACNFEYDGHTLDSYGFILCEFGGPSDYDVVGVGSQITFNTVPMHRGKRYGLAGTSYDECITGKFYICKDPQTHTDLRMTETDYRDLVRWLNRRQFLPFRFCNLRSEQVESILEVSDGGLTVREGALLVSEYRVDEIYYNASFNIGKALINNELYGLELNMETNGPFGYAPEEVELFEVVDTSAQYVLTDKSDEVGHLYPSMTIVCNAAGDLTITNQSQHCTTQIKRCSAGETITIDGLTHIIESSLDSHKIYDDFNFDYPRIGNTLMSRDNVFTVSLPCDLEIRYNPIIKDSPN